MIKKNLSFTEVKRIYIILLPAIAVLVLLIACSKGGSSSGGTHTGGGGTGGGGGSVTDTTAPVLDIFTPTGGQIFNTSTAVSITGKITDDLGLYRGTIRITNDATGLIWREQAYDIHYVLSYNYNLSEVISTPGDYTVRVSFEDHGSNAAAKSVKIKVNP
jgi:hypothetical protein